MIASLNFSFWSEHEGTPDRYGVEWREGWGSDKRVVHTGYWSLVAAIDRGDYLFTDVLRECRVIPSLSFCLRVADFLLNVALEDGIPITDPQFYASEVNCPDSLIQHVFREAPQSKEGIPLLAERMSILRQNGQILCNVRFKSVEP